MTTENAVSHAQDMPVPDVQIVTHLAEDDVTVSAYAVLVDGDEVDRFATREEADAEAAGQRAARRRARLFAAALFIGEHPELNPHQVRFDDSRIIIHDFSLTTADDLVRVSRSIGGRWEKQDSDTLFRLVSRVTDDITVELVVFRDAVCERVVTGTETVEIPDPDAPKVTVERDVVEWRCAPLLAERESQAA